MPENMTGSLNSQYDNTLDAESVLRERLKKLRCLYGISRLVESKGDSLDDILQGIVDLIPSSWQYPEICFTRLIIDDREYKTAESCQSGKALRADIFVRGLPVGFLEVRYKQGSWQQDDRPFLKEELDLLDAIAERMGKEIERIRAKQQVDKDRVELREANAALRKVLSKIEEEKKEWNNSIAANVDKIIMPTIRNLDGKIPPHLRQIVTLLKQQLDELTSPFANQLSRTYGELTPVEIEICNMIRNGLGTKEIARMRHVSTATIAKQRERIRKKLHVSGTTTNLGSYLRMLESDNS